jgi:hypothetical protein
MGQILLGLFVAYLLYNFIFRFVIPLVRVTRQVKRQVRDFQQQANTQQGGFQGGGYAGSSTVNGSPFEGAPFSGTSDRSSTRNAGHKPSAENGTSVKEPKPRKDDYIDFEEIK